jgi:hypothetical protein
MKKKKMYWATFNRFEFQMPREAVLACHHIGECGPEVEYWEPRIDLSKIKPKLIRDELKEYGSWDASELKDDEANRQRIIWIAAGNIQDEKEFD